MDPYPQDQNEPLLTSRDTLPPALASLAALSEEYVSNLALPTFHSTYSQTSSFPEPTSGTSLYNHQDKDTVDSSSEQLTPLLDSQSNSSAMHGTINEPGQPAQQCSARLLTPIPSDYDNISEDQVSEILSPATTAHLSSTVEQQPQPQPAFTTGHSFTFTEELGPEEPSSHNVAQPESLPNALESDPRSPPIPVSPPPVAHGRKLFSLSGKLFRDNNRDRDKRRSLTSSSPVYPSTASIEIAKTAISARGHQRSISQPQAAGSSSSGTFAASSNNGSNAAGISHPSTPMSAVPTLVTSPNMNADGHMYSGTFSPSAPPVHEEQEEMHNIGLGVDQQQSREWWRPRLRDRNSKLPICQQLRDLPTNCVTESSSHVHGHDCENTYDAGNETLDEFQERYRYIPTKCSSKKDIKMRRRSWVFIITITLSVISTLLSIIWLIVSFVQPRWGRTIMSGGKGSMSPETAMFAVALLSKIIELSFVTVTVATIGQILTMCATNEKGSITLSEMSVRNWVIQPGSILTHWDSLPRAGPTTTGIIAICATLVSMFYTTASELMVSPKLMYSDWEPKNLSGIVQASYSNPSYVSGSCYTPLRRTDTLNAGTSCLDVKYSGTSFRSLTNFLQDWSAINDVGIGATPYLDDRPMPTSVLFDNVTLTGSWILTNLSNATYEYLNVSQHRVVNEVNLAMPHPGVYQAAINEVNGILQPQELSGVGEYMIRAGVVSPVVNVTCVEATREELKPLIWPSWLNDSSLDYVNPNIDRSALNGTWFDSVPDVSEWEKVSTPLNAYFNWGPSSEGGTLAPAFPVFPAEYNMVANTTVLQSSAMYFLSKPPDSVSANYTLCSVQSYLSPNCSTHFNISGTNGASMKANCFDKKDEDRYDRWNKDAPQNKPDGDWRNMMQEWSLALDMNGGTTSSNASNSRILTQFALANGDKGYPALSTVTPSMAEVLAVVASSGLVIGSLDAQFYHYWGLEVTSVTGVRQYFNATIRSQEFTSGHTKPWNCIFYTILIGAVLINLFSFVYLMRGQGLLTDFTEPQNMFTLALNSPPSMQLNGSCGGGPSKNHMNIPFRVGFTEVANHYYFEDVTNNEKAGTSVEEEPKTPDFTYRRLSKQSVFPNRINVNKFKRRSTLSGEFTAR